ncbi:MAG: aspartate carbamoyltransferase regulatory subunit [Candidatus Thorarchaeota archaeon]|nr:aspartate carbamoyltransferase regulatory subunit [Candidatus Thorarchaeota archaeon]
MDERQKVEGIRVVKIDAGTVIDHIRAGHALDVLKILGITGREGSVITIAMNITSSKIGRKDIVKLEKRLLEEREVARIALVAPEATINLIEDGKVTKKNHVQLPETIVDVITCPNQRCVTNKEREPITPKYKVTTKEPVSLKCHYCWTIIGDDEIIAQFTESR